MKHSLFITYFVAAAGCCVLFSGCAEQRPAGFPNVVPASAEITDGQTPLPDITVALTPQFELNNVVCGGFSNSSGKAEIFSSWAAYKQSGAPAGEYKICLREQITVKRKTTPEQYSAMTFDEQKKDDEEYAKQLNAVKRKIPAVLSDISKTPLKWTLNAENNALRIDISQFKK